MVRPIVPLVAALNLSTVDEVQVSRENGKALRAESRESMVATLVLVYQVVHHLDFQSPCDIFAVLVEKFVHEILSILTATGAENGSTLG